MTRAGSCPHSVTRLCALAAAAALAALAAAPDARAQAPLLTAGVEVRSANLTQATYSLFVANRGDAPATGVVLVNEVPANTAYSGSDRTPLPPTAGGAACNSGAAAGTRCRWSLGDIPPRASHTVNVTYSLDQGDSGYLVSNTASIEAGTAEVHPNTDNALRRTVDVLGEDAHVDDSRPDTNFGACPHLSVRRDNGSTAFLDNDTMTANGFDTVATMWAAELRAVVDPASSTPAASVPIGVHRIVSHDWDEGSGGCEGANGSERQVRAPTAAEPGTEPQSATSPVATATVSGPGTARWDIRSALDTRDERVGFSGFELRAAGGSGSGADTAAFHSSDAAAATDLPRVVTVRSDRPSTRCIDADAETATGPADGGQRIDAYVTDGDSRVSGAGGDACTGFPVAGAAVGWELDDDDPDAYLSNLAGVEQERGVESPGDAAPDEGGTVTTGDGGTFAEIGLSDPFGPVADLGENRVAAIALIGLDDLSGGAAPQGTPQGVAEPGESVREDDVLRDWSGPLGTPPIAPPSGGPSGGGPTGGPGPATEIAQRVLTLDASNSRATVGNSVKLVGSAASPAAGCAGPGEYVRILRRLRGQQELSEFASVSTDSSGSFELPLLVDASAEYRATWPPRTGCPEASSAPVDVLALGRVRASLPGSSRLRRGARTRIYGRVAPGRAGSAVLERRSGAKWKRVSSRRLGSRSTFSFPLVADWRGRRTFRVRWRSPSATHLDGVSRELALTVK